MASAGLMGSRTAPGRRLWILAVPLFCVVATLGAGGYRYGISDQAFYLPAIERHLSPESFPRDREVMDAQDRLNLFTWLAARVVGATGVSVPVLFAALHVATLALLGAGALAFAASLGLSSWAILSLLMAMSLRHRVGAAAVNTLEPYMHPRMLAFAVAVWGVVAAMRGRPWAALGIAAVAAAIHPTTAIWFAAWIGLAALVNERRARPVLLALAALAAGLGVWLLGWGPMKGRLAPMDREWLAALHLKRYLFPDGWSLRSWAQSLLYVVIVVGGFGLRRMRGLAHPRERGMVFGALALAAVFAATLPAVNARIAFAVQLQVPRVFWMIEFVAILYAAWFVTDRLPVSILGPGRVAARAGACVTGIFVAAGLARGIYETGVRRPERQAIRLQLPGDEWQDAMDWLRGTPLDTHVLAHPRHADLYGTSVRVAAGRDVLLEIVKDSAMAIYSREVAVRVLERMRAVGAFHAMTASAAREIALRYDLDYLVARISLDLPVAYRNSRFTIYRLRGD